MQKFRKPLTAETALPSYPQTRYQPIKPKNELKSSGVVTAVVRKYK